MSKGEMQWLENLVGFWAALILATVTSGWQSLACAVISGMCLLVGWSLRRELWPSEPRDGFWSKVWRR